MILNAVAMEIHVEVNVRVRRIQKDDSDVPFVTFCDSAQGPWSHKLRHSTSGLETQSKVDMFNADNMSKF